MKRIVYWLILVGPLAALAQPPPLPPPPLGSGQNNRVAPPQTPPPSSPNSGASSANKDQGFVSKKTGKPISKAEIEDITNENFPDMIESFDYPNADIADVIKAISELTGKNSGR